MKNIKKVFVLLLSVLLLFSMSFITANASVVPETTETTSGKVVTIQFCYDGIAGIRGTFTVTGDKIVKEMAFTASNNFSGSYNKTEGIIAYYAPSAAKFVGTLEVTLTDNAAVGDECKITLEYETTSDGKLPTNPVYKYDYATIKIGVDYTELNKQIAIAEKLDKDDYTDATWKVLEDALKEAVNAKNSNVQATVDAAAKALEKAISGLKLKPTVTVDYTELNKQIAIAETLEKDDYTEDSWKALEKALKKAIEAKDSNSQATVDSAAKALKNAIKALVPKSGDKESVNYKELRELIESVEGLNKDGYSSKSWKRYEAALEKAMAALNSGSQEEIDAALAELRAAIENLEPKKSDTVIESPATQDVSNFVPFFLIVALGVYFVYVSKKKIESKVNK